MGENFTYVGEDTQISYRPSRSALAEWYRRHDGTWGLSGYLWDGEVRSLDHAKQLTAEYLAPMVGA